MILKVVAFFLFYEISLNLALHAYSNVNVDKPQPGPTGLNRTDVPCIAPTSFDVVQQQIMDKQDSYFSSEDEASSGVSFPELIPPQKKSETNSRRS